MNSNNLQNNQDPQNFTPPNYGDDQNYSQANTNSNTDPNYPYNNNQGLNQDLGSSNYSNSQTNYDYNQSQQDYSNPSFDVASENNSPDPYYNQTQYQDPNINQDYTNLPEQAENQEGKDSDSSFQEKQGGNRVFFIIAGIVLLLFLIATGVLVYLNFRDDAGNIDLNGLNGDLSSSSSSSSSDPNSQSSSSSSSNSDSSSSQSANNLNSQDNSQTGNQTPASLAKKFNASVIPTEWLSRTFDRDDINPDGSCKTVTVCGDRVDSEGDGLTNLEEYNYQTDPLSKDSDNDGLADGDEVKVYQTDPNLVDSDNDSYEDGQEIIDCYDPILRGNENFADSRLSDLKQNIQLSPLKEPTISTLSQAGANRSDINNGYINTNCGNSTSNSSTSSSSSSTSSSSSRTSSSSSSSTVSSSKPVSSIGVGVDLGN